MVHKTDWEKDTVYLYQFPRPVGIPNISPYCLKIETWLRIVGAKYEIMDSFLVDRKSKEGTLPFVEYNGREYYDSEFIVQELGKELDSDPDSWLSEEQQATATCLYGTFDFPFLHCMLSERLNDMDKTWDLLPADKMPWFMKTLSLGKAIMKRNMGKILANGRVGKHSADEIYSIGCRFLKAASTILGDKDYLFGSKPCTSDAILFSHVTQLIKVDLSPKLGAFVKTDCKNLVEHTDRIIQEYWKDWDELVAKPEPLVEPAAPKSEDATKSGDAPATEAS